MAHYCSLDSWLFWTTVDLSFLFHFLTAFSLFRPSILPSFHSLLFLSFSSSSSSSTPSSWSPSSFPYKLTKEEMNTSVSSFIFSLGHKLTSIMLFFPHTATIPSPSQFVCICNGVCGGGGCVGVRRWGHCCSCCCSFCCCCCV